MPARLFVNTMVLIVAPVKKSKLGTVMGIRLVPLLTMSPPFPPAPPLPEVMLMRPKASVVKPSIVPPSAVAPPEPPALPVRADTAPKAETSPEALRSPPLPAPAPPDAPLPVVTTTLSGWKLAGRTFKSGRGTVLTKEARLSPVISPPAPPSPRTATPPAPVVTVAVLALEIRVIKVDPVGVMAVETSTAWLETPRLAMLPPAPALALPEALPPRPVEIV